MLGLHWDPVCDELFYKVKLNESPSTTKRQGLSDTVIAKAKIFIQTLWLEKLDWDTPLPPGLLSEWLTFRESLRCLEQIRIPRWFGLRPDCTPHLNGFIDASVKAYAAAIYLCSVNAQGDRTRISSLLTSKTRVAPAKIGISGLALTTIPRLELCAAQLLANTMANIRSTLGLADVPYTLWTDSRIVLDWLRKTPSTLKQSVANRVQTIQQHSDICNWRHVRTKVNPADCASRGLMADALIHHTLWWHGPLSLSSDDQSPTNYPPLTEDEIGIMAAETKPIKANVAQTVRVFSIQTQYKKAGNLIVVDLIDRCSKLGGLVRITAYVLRMHLKRRQYWHQYNNTVP